MALITYLILIVQIILAVGVPIDDGTDVGTIKEHKGRKIVLNPGTFPYMVRLEFRRYYVEKTEKDKVKNITPDYSNCGGSLIRRDVVLTAAHCIRVHIEKKPNILAWLGILDTELEQGRGQEIPVRGYTIHNKYVRGNPQRYHQSFNDIALLWLVKPANLGEYVKLATLPTADFNAVGNWGQIVGWGRQSCGPRKTMLQQANVKALAPAECQKYYKYTKIGANVICILSDSKTKTSTNGDSGGPFVVQNTVVGVASFSAIDSKNKNACDATKPAGYTYVPRYLDWIQQNLQNGPQVILRKIWTSTTSSPKVSRRPTSKSKL